MDQITEIAKALTTPVLASFVAAVGAYLIYQMVFKGKRFVSPTGNGKEVNGVVTNAALQQIHQDIRDLAKKMDELRVEVAGNYVKKDSMVAIGGRLDEVRERAIKIETRSEVQKEQLSEIFRRLNALETKRKEEDTDG